MLPMYFTVILIVVLFLLNDNNKKDTTKECVTEISEYKVKSLNIQRKPTPDDLRIVINSAVAITNKCNELLTEDEIHNMQNYVVDAYSELYNLEKNNPAPDEHEENSIVSKTIKPEKREDR